MTKENQKCGACLREAAHGDAPLSICYTCEEHCLWCSKARKNHASLAYPHHFPNASAQSAEAAPPSNLPKAEEAPGNLPQKKYYIDGIRQKNGYTYAVLREKDTGDLVVSATLNYILDVAQERGYLIVGVTHPKP